VVGGTESTTKPSEQVSAPTLPAMSTARAQAT
jgi:hypothetical protein